MKRIFSLIAFIAVLTFASCEKRETPVLSVSPQSLSFSGSGGSETISINANYPWTASVSGSGFTVSPSSGEGNAQVTVTATANRETSPKSETLTIKSENLSVTVALSQDEKPVLEPGDVTAVPAEGAIVSVDIKYNVDYNVVVEDSAKSWISVVATKSVQTGTLQFKVAANDTYDERVGKVSIVSKSETKTLTFSQKAASAIILGAADEIPSAGGTVQVPVQYNVDYDVVVEDSAKSWVTYVATKALKSGMLEFEVAANESAETRTATVTLSDKAGVAKSSDVLLIQKGKPTIVVETNNYVFTGEFEDIVEIPVNYDGEIEVDSSAAPEWHSSFTTERTGSGYVVCFYVGANYFTECSYTLTIKSKDGLASPVDVTISQDQMRFRKGLMAIYNALDGPNWTNAKGWGKDDVNFRDWPLVDYYSNDQSFCISESFNAKGELPDCFGLMEGLTKIDLRGEGISGSLPPSFAKLDQLTYLSLVNTSITNISDNLCACENLTAAQIIDNLDLTGTLPEALVKSDKLQRLRIINNSFTGSVPESWAKVADRLYAQADEGEAYYAFDLEQNRLSGKIPQSFTTGEFAAEKIWSLSGQKGDGIDVSDIDVPYFMPSLDLVDAISGKAFNAGEVVKDNKYTIMLYWADWCPFSKMMMPDVKAYYERFHKDGLEIIAYANTQVKGYFPYDEIRDKGYTSWYNVNLDSRNDFDSFHYALGISGVPSAEVWDSEGGIVFSGKHYKDSRGRFDRPASTDLVSFLESVYGKIESEIYESTDYSKDGEVMTIQKATKGNGIDIVFMGDGYADKDMASGGKYETLMKGAADEFFAIEPYATLRDYFNVYAVKAVSKNDRAGSGYSTALDGMASSSDGGTSFFINEDKVAEYAMKVPGIDSINDLLVTVIINDKGVGAITYQKEDTQSAIALIPSFGDDPSSFGSALRHEAGGHGFAFLADEYYREGTVSEDVIKRATEQSEKYGWWANIDFTNDPSKIKWSIFLTDERYKNEVGIYEGGFASYSKGVYRPTEDSIMRNDAEVNKFNAPSRYAIFKQVMKRAGNLDDSFEKFKSIDK